MPDKPQNADHANARLEAAIQRHAGWQLEYDFAIVINDRKRLLARIAELEGNLDAIRGWTRSRLEILADRRREYPETPEQRAKTAVLDDLTRVLDHLDTIPAPDIGRASVPDAASNTATTAEGGPR